MRKYKVEDLYVVNISDRNNIEGYYSCSTVEPYLTIGKYSGGKKCFVFDTKERIKVYSRYSYFDIEDNEKVAEKLMPLSFCLKDKNVKSVSVDDILYMQQQLYDWLDGNVNLLEISEDKSMVSKKDNKIVSNEFFLEIKKVMDKINPNMSEELQEEYKTKLSNIGNEYINSVIENYNSIKLNPSIELEILKKYLEKLGVLEEEIVKSNYRSNLESELEQVKRYTNNN